ncbi:BON domain-containing protein [Arcicella aquatica]|uniref:BON domain-containing protein n=1 Tax=Arcicella aquatica TaxID=217141 RepID=A0ABU5QSZ8_9BACT|nr:BON domain-containing protein [Arcicella aquatica]MEA5260216.1 BON domain-containing protein [Arcicella aquatica]
MKSNEELQKDVQEAIKWEPLLHAAEIGVTAKDGIVTLTGTVDNYIKKNEAETAAKNVVGVSAVIEKIQIKFKGSLQINDEETAKDALNALKWDWQVPHDTIKVKIEDGWVTLTGNVRWNYQKEAAKKAVSSLQHVKGVTNDIAIKEETADEIEQKDIEQALGRTWSIVNADIKVKVNGHKVTLSGTVESIFQKDEAERIAWNAPGVWHLENNLVVEYRYSLVG